MDGPLIGTSVLWINDFQTVVRRQRGVSEDSLYGGCPHERFENYLLTLSGLGIINLYFISMQCGPFEFITLSGNCSFINVSRCLERLRCSLSLSWKNELSHLGFI